jgi:hypothetical protein
LQESLSALNYDRLVLLAAETMAERFCTQTLTLHKFTQLGGLQLEKDVRTLVTGFGDLTPDRIPTHKGEGVRAKLAKLNNMAAILALDSHDCSLEELSSMVQVGDRVTE